GRYNTGRVFEHSFKTSAPFRVRNHTYTVANELLAFVRQDDDDFPSAVQHCLQKKDVGATSRRRITHACTDVFETLPNCVCNRRLKLFWKTRGPTACLIDQMAGKNDNSRNVQEVFNLRRIGFPMPKKQTCIATA